MSIIIARKQEWQGKPNHTVESSPCHSEVLDEICITEAIHVAIPPLLALTPHPLTSLHLSSSHYSSGSHNCNVHSPSPRSAPPPPIICFNSHLLPEHRFVRVYFCTWSAAGDAMMVRESAGHIKTVTSSHWSSYITLAFATYDLWLVHLTFSLNLMSLLDPNSNFQDKWNTAKSIAISPPHHAPNTRTHNATQRTHNFTGTSCLCRHISCQNSD